MAAVARVSVLLVIASVLAAGPVTARHAPADAPAFLMGGLSDVRVDTDGDGVVDTLSIGVPVRVRDAGTYRVNVTLAWGTSTPSPVFWTAVDLTPGDHVVRVPVPADFVRNTGHSGTFTVTATLARGAGADAPALDDHPYTTQGYAPADWPEPVARVPTEPLVVPYDADANGVPDGLRVDVPVNATRGGAYRLSFCSRAPDAQNATCRAPVNVTLARPGGLVTFDLPPTTLPLNASTFTLDARVVLVAGDPERVVHALDWVTPAFRSAAFAPDAAPVGNATVDPVVDGNALADGLAFRVDAHVPRPERRDVHVVLLDPASGARAEARAASARADAAGPVTLTARVGAADTARVITDASAPVLHWRVLDPFGLTLAGGRVDLPGKPVPRVVVEADADVIAGDAVTLVDASTVTRGVVAARTWRVDGEAEGVGQREVVTLPRRGTVTVTLDVVNAWGVSASVARDVRVGPNLPPTPDTPERWTMNEGENGTLELHASDPEGRATTWRLADAPAGMRLDGHVLTWRPGYDAQGSHVVRLVLSDGYHDVERALTAIAWNMPAPPGTGAGDAESGTVRITGVAGRPLPPEVVVAHDAPYRLVVEAAGADGAAVPVSLAESPPGATFENGMLAWDAPAEGRHVLRFTAPGADDVVVALVVGDAAAATGAVAGATTDPLQAVAFVTPALAAGFAALAGLVARKRARK